MLLFCWPTCRECPGGHATGPQNQQGFEPGIVTGLGPQATLTPKDPNPCKTHEALQTPPRQSSAKEFHPLLQCSRRVNSCHVLDLARAAGAFSRQVPVTAVVTN